MASTSKEGDPLDDGTQLTYNETIDAICGFIKTAVHTILCHRQVYPPNVFTRKQRYRIPVWVSRHPGLNGYIDDVINATRVQIQKNLVRSVHMVLSSSTSGQVLEKYRFDVDFILQDVPLRDRDFSIPGNMDSKMLDLQLRAFMMKLISLDGALYDIEDPEDVTWALVLDTDDEGIPTTSDLHGNEPEQGLWVPYSSADGQQGRKKDKDLPSYLHAKPAKPRSDISAAEKEEQNALILPVKSLDTGVINLIFYVEERPSVKQNSSYKAKKPQVLEHVSKKKRVRQAHRQAEDHIDERDIDEPLPQPSSSGMATQRRKKDKKSIIAQHPSETNGHDNETDEASESSDGESSGSEDSIKSVNDFAGYGKGPGGVGMSGIGM